MNKPENSQQFEFDIYNKLYQRYLNFVDLYNLLFDYLKDDEKGDLNKIKLNNDEKICDCFTGDRLKDFQKVVKAMSNDVRSTKIIRFKYLYLTDNPTFLFLGN